MKFNDGMEFNTSGQYRIEHKSDGLYVVGNGILCPIDSRNEGEQIIANWRERKRRKPRSSSRVD